MINTTEDQLKKLRDLLAHPPAGIPT